MNYIERSTTDPALNLAVEELLVRERADLQPLFMLWQNANTIVIGRNQNAAQEVDRAEVARRGVCVVRRMTGGGAVYHDLGNLNFSFILQDPAHRGFDFARFLAPVTRTLAQFGVQAQASGRNDIVLKGAKFSGNAQYRYREVLLHHGTLLFDSDMTVLTGVLRPDPAKLHSRGVASIHSRVTNLRPYLPAGMTLEQFKQALVQEVGREYGSLKPITLEPDFLHKAEALAQSRYRNPAWVWRENRRFNRERRARYPWGTLQVRMQVERDRIADIELSGDFFALCDLSELEERLLNLPFTPQQIRSAVRAVPLDTYIPGAQTEQLLALLLPDDDSGYPVRERHGR